MKTKSPAALGLVAAALVLSSAPEARADWPEDHLDTVDLLFSEYTPANNEYDEPSKIEFVDGELVIAAVCGGFVAQLLKMSYPDILTASLLQSLTGSPSPNSTTWHAAIVDEATVETDDGVYAFVHRVDADEIAAGDILAAEYPKSGQTGHTMMVYAIDPPTEVASTIPGYAAVSRYRVTVVDSTKSVHQDSKGSSDTRYLHDVDAQGNAVNDRGFGSGEIYLYADPESGEVIGWTWSLKQSVAYQGVDPEPGKGVGEFRPIAAGRLTGPGLASGGHVDFAPATRLTWK
ncbi:MAG: hypothetical protein R3B09_19005 [Nannocystaceae bacterium]